MFTVVKAREEPDKTDPNGWYTPPAGTVAGPAAAERMRADGIEPSVRK